MPRSEVGPGALLSLEEQLHVLDLLRKDPACTTLRLRGHGLGIFIASEFAHVLAHVNKTLTALDLADNAIGDDGAAELARVLTEGHAPLTHLDLSGNGIGEEGAEALLGAIGRGRHHLRQCVLRGNAVGEAMQGQVARACLSATLNERLAAFADGQACACTIAAPSPLARGAVTAPLAARDRSLPPLHGPL